ncbi:MAG: hypothetical protein WCO84_06480, partial [bacterium]
MLKSLGVDPTEAASRVNQGAIAGGIKSQREKTIKERAIDIVNQSELIQYQPSLSNIKNQDDPIKLLSIMRSLKMSSPKNKEAQESAINLLEPLIKKLQESDKDAQVITRGILKIPTPENIAPPSAVSIPQLQIKPKDRDPDIWPQEWMKPLSETIPILPDKTPTLTSKIRSSLYGDRGRAETFIDEARDGKNWRLKIPSILDYEPGKESREFRNSIKEIIPQNDNPSNLYNKLNVYGDRFKEKPRSFIEKLFGKEKEYPNINQGIIKDLPSISYEDQGKKIQSNLNNQNNKNQEFGGTKEFNLNVSVDVNNKNEEGKTDDGFDAKLKMLQEGIQQLSQTIFSQSGKINIIADKTNINFPPSSLSSPAPSQPNGMSINGADTSLQ